MATPAKGKIGREKENSMEERKKAGTIIVARFLPNLIESALCLVRVPYSFPFLFSSFPVRLSGTF